MNLKLDAIYLNEYDTAQVRARVLLGGKINEDYACGTLKAMQEHAKELLVLTGELRHTTNLAKRSALEEVRKEAVLLMGACKESKQAHVGCIVMIPKSRKMFYTESVLIHYERMMASLDWFYDLSGEPV